MLLSPCRDATDSARETRTDEVICAHAKACEGRLARALFDQGDSGRARGEQLAARTAFESLGARPDLARLIEFSDTVDRPE